MLDPGMNGRGGTGSVGISITDCGRLPSDLRGMPDRALEVAFEGEAGEAGTGGSLAEGRAAVGAPPVIDIRREERERSCEARLEADSGRMVLVDLDKRLLPSLSFA